MSSNLNLNKMAAAGAARRAHRHGLRQGRRVPVLRASRTSRPA
ncbi:MAG: hypothetical protein WDN72_11135 [Alphaproteobacteria bacterium]